MLSDHIVTRYVSWDELDALDIETFVDDREATEEEEHEIYELMDNGWEFVEIKRVKDNQYSFEFIELLTPVPSSDSIGAG